MNQNSKKRNGVIVGELLRVENSVDDILIQYDLISYKNDINQIDAEIDLLQQKIDEINGKIGKYTNESDWIDNTVAISSGIICGMIDSVFVSDFSFEKANEWGNEKTNNFVVRVAKTQGYTGNDLAGAVRFLEEKYPIAADKATNAFGGGRQHHLRDFSHHPTPVGLFFSLLTQFTKKVYGTTTAGVFTFYDLREVKDGLLLVGNNFPEKITFGVINWFFHLVSDMTGSSSSIAMGKIGTGVPGPIGSLLKEASCLPVFTSMTDDGYKEFSVWVSKLFNGTLLGQHDENGKITSAVKFDLRTEVGALHQLGKQAVPVLINECVVRGFYFIRRFINEISKIENFKQLKNVNWKNVIPAKNRTIVRMLTISSGTFMTVDMADAAIKAVATSGGTVATFCGQFLLRVNFVGVGRFAIAVGSDMSMETKKSYLESQISSIKSQIMFYKEAKVYYRVGSSMEIAIDAEKVIDGLRNNIINYRDQYRKVITDMDVDSKDIIALADGFKNKNPKATKELIDILSEV